MKPWVLLDTATIPAGEGTLRLLRRDTEFSLRLEQTELMSSRVRGSEEALARLACAKIEPAAPRMLIGGLGMGFTLRAALGLVGPEARIVVAELIPAVVAWGRGPMAELFGDSLDDPRVTIHIGDVGQLIRAETSGFDAILLDVDNGPAGLTRDSNEGLYGLAGLTASFAALAPGGVLTVWSATPDAAFTQRLRKVGFGLEEQKVRAHANQGARHTIWVAVRPVRSGLSRA